MTTSNHVQVVGGPECLPEVYVDIPEAYKNNAEADRQFFVPRIYDPIKFLELVDGYDDIQRAVLSYESSKFAIDPVLNPIEFLNSHNNMIDEYSSELTAKLPELKERAVCVVSNFLSLTGQDRKYTMDLLYGRLEATEEILIYDLLANGQWGDKIGGGFVGNFRQIVVSLIKTIESVERSTNLHPLQDVIDVEIVHELFHGMFVSARQAHWYTDSFSVLNGINIHLQTNPMVKESNQVIDHGFWLNEAVIESHRSEVTGSLDIRYSDFVAVLHGLERILPGFRNSALLVAVGKGKRYELIQQVDDLLGPLSFDRISEILEAGERDDNIPEDDIKKIVEFIPINLKNVFESTVRSQMLHMKQRRKEVKKSWLFVPI